MANNIVGTIKRKAKNIVGELTSWSSTVVSHSGNFYTTYTLGSNKRVDPQLARELYYNSNDDYKLGAAFAKPIINAAVGFIGVPSFKSDDEDAEEALRSFVDENVSKMQRTHRDAMRDGQIFVRLTREKLDSVEDKSLYPERDSIIRYNIIPPENIKDIKRHPVTGKITQYIIETEHKVDDGVHTTITQTITSDSIEIECDGTTPPDLEEGTQKNPWGFIPIVQFTNEKEAYATEPRSDLEGVEPYIKAYHDVFKHAIQGSKLHSTPRLKMQLNDVNAFLRNNFGVDDPQQFIENGQTINLENKDLLIFTGEDEDAEFIEVESAIGSAEPLLKFLFYSIIENSETPEFCFGAHLPANYASVKEQMPVLVRRVGRKREFFSESWRKLARYFLAMKAMGNGGKYSTHTTQLEWSKIDPRDAEDVAKEFKSTVEGLAKAVETGIMDKEQAQRYLNAVTASMDDPQKTVEEDTHTEGTNIEADENDENDEGDEDE